MSIFLDLHTEPQTTSNKLSEFAKLLSSSSSLKNLFPPGSAVPLSKITDSNVAYVRALQDVAECTEYMLRVSVELRSLVVNQKAGILSEKDYIKKVGYLHTDKVRSELSIKTCMNRLWEFPQWCKHMDNVTL